MVEELRLRTIKPARFWFCPNGGNLSKAQAAKFQRMGLTKGVPDLHFVWMTARMGAVQNESEVIPLAETFPRYGVIELKAGYGKPTVEQDQFMSDLAVIGHHYAVCNRADDVFQTLRRWGYPLR